MEGEIHAQCSPTKQFFATTHLNPHWQHSYLALPPMPPTIGEFGSHRQQWPMTRHPPLRFGWRFYR